MKLCSGLCCLLLMCILTVTAAAAETSDAEAANVAEAADVTEAELLTFSVSSSSQDVDAALLTDGDETTYTTLQNGGTFTVTSDAAISSLYVLFDRIPGEWTLSDGVSAFGAGKNSFLHEYIDIADAFGYQASDMPATPTTPTTLTMKFPGKCQISEIYVFGPGETPPWVQTWQPPCERADLLLASTHIDDEQLFFAGVLPYYAGELGLDVQVVYFTTPFTYHERQHEQLDGLWTVGVRHYPVSGEFRDAFSETAKKAYADQEAYGFGRDEMVLFQARMIRRFKPHVVVGHDINGEYSHGQHIINCETLMDALDLAADASFDPDSAVEYGVWDTPKTYIHLWEENPIVMNWDIPLEKFGGKTAFQVTQDGFRCHKSQHWTWFYKWIYGKNKDITKATQIKTYSPCKYGLYRTTVGPDVVGGDMFENIPRSYAEIRAEEERLALESRAESERVSASVAESERLRLEEESRRAEESRLAAESVTNAPETNASGGDRSDRGANAVTIIVVIAGAAAAILLILPQIKPKKRRRRRTNTRGSANMRTNTNPRGGAGGRGNTGKNGRS